jgi:hypothetical protein
MIQLQIIKTLVDNVGTPNRITRTYTPIAVQLEPNDGDTAPEDDPRNFTITFDNPDEAKEFVEIERTFTHPHPHPLEVEDNLSDENVWFVFNYHPHGQQVVIQAPNIISRRSYDLDSPGYSHAAGYAE